jgi:hypothetical protein
LFIVTVASTRDDCLLSIDLDSMLFVVSSLRIADHLAELRRGEGMEVLFLNFLNCVVIGYLEIAYHLFDIVFVDISPGRNLPWRSCGAV